MSTEERLKRLLEASQEQLKAIDNILDGRIPEKATEVVGPLLMGMTASAKLLGVSRATLWRMVRAGVLQKIEVLPGSFRLRHADLEAVAAGRKLCPSKVSPHPQHLTKRMRPDRDLSAV